MSALQAYLPPTSGGNLPTWMLFVSSLAVFNSVQNFLTTKLTRKLYSRSPTLVNGLQARTFAVWTMMSAFVRIYAAYHIHNKPVYDLALISYALAFGHFAFEFLVYKTAGLGPALISPLIVSTSSMYWMYTQYNFYVKA